MNYKSAGLVLATALFAAVPSAFASTLHVTPNTTDATYHHAIIKAADRLLTLQNGNGSWDWIVTGATGATSNTYLNITGVTAEGLLSAYAVTGKQAYLDGAKNAASFIVSQISSSSPMKINAYNVLFLQKLATVSGDSSYSAKAAEFFNDLYATTTTVCSAAPCGTTAGVVAGQKAVRSWAGDPSGIVLWDLVPYVEYAELVGDTTHAQEFATAIISDALSTGYVPNVTNYDLGLASALKAAVLVGDTADAATLQAKIASTDASYGLASDGKIQTTSYMVRAFKIAGDSRADASAMYIATSTLSTGGWIDTDGNEYAEVDSEAATALAQMLPQVPQYYALQDAIDESSGGDTINADAGTYDGFSVVGKSGLTISGAGAGSTIIATSSLIDSGTAHKYTSDMQVMVLVKNSTGITLKGLTVNDNGKTPGAGGPDALIFWDASSGTIQNAAVTGAYTIDGVQTGQGIAVDASGSDNVDLTIDNTSISGFQKNGIDVINGNGSTSGATGTVTVTVKDGSITGAGPTSLIGQNGLVLWNRGGGTVSGTIDGTAISNFIYTPTDATAAGALAYGGGSLLTVRRASFTNNQLNLSTTAGSPAIDAAQNYWGNATGPAASTLDGAVSYAPWYTDAARTNLMSTTTVSGDEASTTLPVAVTQTGTVNSVSVTAEIPQNTVITASSSWDGTILAPTAGDSSGSTPTGFSVGAAVVEVGSPTVTLNFSQPVKLTLAGVTGAVAYKAAGSSIWTPITTKCNSASDSSNITSGECYATSGSDTVIWTYHYTTFGPLVINAPVITPNGGDFAGFVNVTMDDSAAGSVIRYTTDGSDPTCGSGSGYTNGQVLNFNTTTTLKAIRCDASNNASTIASATFQPFVSHNATGGGGGGGGGGSIGSIIAATPATPAVPTVSPAVPATPANPHGQVLGAAGYKFTLALALGSSNADVSALQQYLKDNGFFSAEVTGYFGKLTRAAVIAFQKARGIAQTGTVGPLTRAELNKTVSDVVSGKTNLTASQVTSILNVLNSFGADADTIAKVKAALGQ